MDSVIVAFSGRSPSSLSYYVGVALDHQSTTLRFSGLPVVAGGLYALKVNAASPVKLAIVDGQVTLTRAVLAAGTLSANGSYVLPAQVQIESGEDATLVWQSMIFRLYYGATIEADAAVAETETPYLQALDTRVAAAAEQALTAADAAANAATSAAGLLNAVDRTALSSFGQAPIALASDCLRVKVTRTLDVFDETKLQAPGLSSIYWPWVVRAEGRIANPLGRYYLYYSSDHAGTDGWIGMAYSDNLLSGWTDYGQVFRNYSNLQTLDTPLETETPSVVWNEEHGEFIMYFQSASSYSGEAQTSWYVTSEDGIHWSNRTKMFDLDPSRLPGNAHNGYAHPFSYMGTLFAYSLMGGGNGGTALSYSIDGGYHWVTDHKLLGRWLLGTDQQSLYPHHGTIVHLHGMTYWIGIQQNFASGLGEKIARIVAVPMADLRRPFGKPVTLVEAADATYESANLRAFSIYQEGEALYLFYHCAVGEDSFDCFNVAVLEATTNAELSPHFIFTQQPVSVEGNYGSVEGRLSVTGYATDGSPASYQWYVNDARTTVGASLIAGATEPYYDLPNNLQVGCRYYYCKLTSQTAGTAISAMAAVTVRMLPTIAFTTQPLDASVTEGMITGVLRVAASANNGAAVSYQWYGNTVAINSGGTAVSGATVSAMSLDTALTAGTYYYYCVASSTGLADVASDVATVAVAEIPTISFTTQPTSATEYRYQGEPASAITLTALATSSDGSAVAYQWYTAEDADGTIGNAAIASEISSDLEVGIRESDIGVNRYYYCVATGAMGGSATSRVAAVTVARNKIYILTQPTGITVMEGAITESLVFNCFSMIGGSLFGCSLYRNTAMLSTGGTLVAKISSETPVSMPIPTDLTVGSYYFYCVVDAAGGRKATNAVTVTVISTDAPTISFTTQPTDASVTAGSITGGLTVAATASDNSAVSYQWYSNTTASNVGGTIYPEKKSATMTFYSALKAGTYYYYCVASATGLLAVASDVATVTVEAAPTISFTTQPTDASATAGSITGGLTVVAAASDSSSVSYQWYSNTTASNTGGALITGATSASMTIDTALTAGTYYYYCVAASDTAGSCASNVATVTVSNPAVSFTTQPGNLSVYAGSVIGLLRAVATAPDASAVTYQWYGNTTASSTGGTAISGETSERFAIPADITETTYYYCVASSATATSAASDVSTVTVSALTDLASYALTGTASAAAPATIADDTGNGNTLTVNGITAYDADGRLTGGAGKSLYLPSLDLSGNASYVLFMEFYNPSGITTQHRLFECATGALGLQISTPSAGYVKLRFETSGSAFTSPADSALATHVHDRAYWVHERLLIAVANDVLTVRMQVLDNDGRREILGMSLAATGFTAALTSGVYFLNRADGTRALSGSLTALRVAVEGGGT